MHLAPLAGLVVYGGALWLAVTGIRDYRRMTPQQRQDFWREVARHIPGDWR